MIDVKTVAVRLPYEPHKGQQQILADKRKFQIVCCGRRWGKSLLAQFKTVEKILNGDSVAYLTPTYSLAKTFFKDLSDLLPDEAIESVNKSDLTIETVTGGIVKFFSGDSDTTINTSFRGNKFKLVIIDEAAFIPALETTFWSAIYPSMSEFVDSQVLMISTPNGHGFFQKLFEQGTSGQPDFAAYHFATNTNPAFPASEFERARTTLPPAQFQEEYLAIPGQNVRSPIGSDHIRFNTVQALSNEPTEVFGIDLASTYDFTVIVGLDDHGSMTHFERFQERDWTKTIERVAELPPEVTKIIDSTGVGAVVYDSLIKRGVLNLIPFRFSSDTKPKLMNELIRAIQSNELKFNQITANELSNLIEIKTESGYSKYQAYGSGHDDCVMALALANYHKSRSAQAKNWKLYYV